MKSILIPKKQSKKEDEGLEKEKRELITYIQKHLDEISARLAPFIEYLKLCAQIKNDKYVIRVFRELQPPDLDKLRTLVRTAKGFTRGERLYFHGVIRRYAAYLDGTLDTRIHALYEEGKHREGLTLVREWLGKIEGDDILLAREGLCLSSLGHHREAIASFDRSIAIDAGVAAWWVFRGDSYSELGEYDAAIRDFFTSFSLDETNWAAYDKCARAYYLSGRKEEAIRYEEYAVEKGKSPEATLVLIEMLKDVGDRERARTVAKKGLKQFPNDYRFRDFIDELKGS